MTQNPLELPFITPVETPTVELATPIASPMAQPIETPTVELATPIAFPIETPIATPIVTLPNFGSAPSIESIYNYATMGQWYEHFTLERLINYIINLCYQVFIFSFFSLICYMVDAF